MILAGALMAAALTGCTSEGMIYERTGSVDAPQQSGVVIVDTDNAQVGMSGTTCDVATSGEIGTDYDYPGNADVVQDAGTDPVTGEGIVVITSDKGVHVQQSDPWFVATSDDYEFDGASDAAIAGDAIVVLDEDKCEITYVHTNQPVRAELDDDYCDGTVELAGDPDSDNSFLGTPQGVIMISPDAGTVEEIDGAPAEIIAWDATAGVLYTASIGGSTVTAVESDGTMRWSTPVDGEVLDISDFGAMGQAIVSLDVNGSGELLFLDGWTGAVVDSKNLPTPAAEVTSSDDGRTIATSRGDRVDFFKAYRLF